MKYFKNNDDRRKSDTPFADQAGHDSRANGF